MKRRKGLKIKISSHLKIPADRITEVQRVLFGKYLNYSLLVGKHDWFNREDNYEEARRKVKTRFVEHETMRVHPKQHFQRHPTQPGTNDKRYSRRLDFENILARPRIRPSKKIRRFRSYLNERATRKRVPNYKVMISIFGTICKIIFFQGHARSARFIPTLDLGASEAGSVRRGRSGRY